MNANQRKTPGMMGVKGWIVLLVALVMAVLATAHISGVNGPEYWTWPWRRLSVSQWLVMLLLALPSMVMIGLLQRRSWRPPWLLLVMMLSALSLKLGCVLSQSQPIGWNYLRQVTWSRDATSYFYDAARLVSTVKQDKLDTWFWFRDFDQLVRTPPPAGLNMHTITKPAGPLLFYFVIVWHMDYTSVSLVVASLALMVLSLSSIPATYWCVKQFTDQVDSGLIAAALVAVSPGFNLFSTKFDPLWIGLGAMTLGAWQLALTRRSGWLSLLLGLLLAMILFVGFQQLTLGLFMALMPAIVLPARPLWQRYWQAVQLGLPAIGIAIGAHVLLALVSGYNSWKVFQANWYAQGQLLDHPLLSARRAPWTTVGDLYDFALGGGWVVAAVLVMGLFNGQLSRQVRLLGVAACVLMGVIAVLARSRPRRLAVGSFWRPLR